MMLYPSINDLMKNVDSRYALVIATAKRARNIAEIQAENPNEFDSYNVSKPVAIAVREISGGKVTFFGKQNKVPVTALEIAMADALKKQEN